MVLTLLCCLGLTYGVIKATRKSWDYVVTTSIIHLVLCIIGGQQGTVTVQRMHCHAVCAWQPTFSAGGSAPSPARSERRAERHSSTPAVPPA
jgi:hypothetical protein